MALDVNTLKARVKGAATFSYFYDGALWYTCCDGWKFPIPVADTVNQQGGAATFNASEKGILLMRWIRKHMELEDRDGNE